MDKNIYKITNIVNKKVYIGQTVNFKKRKYNHIRELRNNEHFNSGLQEDWNEYKESSFIFEVIGLYEDYNDKEKYYISLYESQDETKGYNVDEGGENPPIIRGEDSILSTHTQNDIERIIYDLENSELSINAIAVKHNYTSSSITRINCGRMWRDNKRKYPIRRQITYVNEIKDMLKNSDLSHRSIAEKFGVAKSTVTMINIGKNGFSKDESYPIRKSK